MPLDLPEEGLVFSVTINCNAVHSHYLQTNEFESTVRNLPTITRAHFCYVFRTSTILILSVAMDKFEIPTAKGEPFETAT